MRKTTNKYKLPVKNVRAKLAFSSFVILYYQNKSIFLQIYPYLRLFTYKVEQKCQKIYPNTAQITACDAFDIYKEVKIYFFCAYNFQDFGQTQENFAWLHDRETLTFRNSEASLI